MIYQRSLSNTLIRSEAQSVRSSTLCGTLVVFQDLVDHRSDISSNHFPGMSNGVSERYEVKYTTENPTQLPTTPIAEYELVNINGRNSYFGPKRSSWIREQ